MIGEFFIGQLAVGRGCGMDDQRLDVCDIREQREDLQRVDESVGFFFTALDIKGKDRGAAVREILLIQRVIGMIRQRRMVDFHNLRMFRKIFNDFLGVLGVTLQTKREGLCTLQKQKCREG